MKSRCILIQEHYYQPCPYRTRIIKKEQIIIEGDIPNPADPPTGCTFHTRCPFKMDICTKVTPQLMEQNTGHSVACHLYVRQVDNDIKQLEGSL